MSIKAERRAEKQRLKDEKARKLSERYAAEYDIKAPIVAVAPEKPTKVVTLPERQDALQKAPKVNEKLKIFDANMSWCVSISDIEGYWSWSEPRNWSNDEWTEEILRELQPYTNQTWSDLAQMSTGNANNGKKRRPRHHEQEISTLVTEAKHRWRDLELEQYDTAYRFRLGGTKRAWGIQLGSHFFLVWFERFHKIYPVD